MILCHLITNLQGRVSWTIWPYVRDGWSSARCVMTWQGSWTTDQSARFIPVLMRGLESKRGVCGDQCAHVCVPTSSLAFASAVLTMNQCWLWADVFRQRETRLDQSEKIYRLCAAVVFKVLTNITFVWIRVYWPNSRILQESNGRFAVLIQYFPVLYTVVLSTVSDEGHNCG